jgi:HTH-type transcriptional regulator/antitoxin HigA
MGIKPVPAQNVGPGRILRRELEAIGWSNADLAEVLGMSGKSVSQLLNDKQAITVPTARLLAQAFSSSPEFWMNLDQNYRLRLAPHDPKEDETALRAKIRARMPLAEMRKKGWIDYDASATSQVKAYRKFWDKDADDFSAYERPDLPFCARLGNQADRQGKQADRQTRDYSITWFQKARSEASRLKAKPYDRERTLALAASLPDYTVESDGPRRFLSALKACGVKFLILEHLSKTYLDGASFMDEKNPVIVYTARYDRVDNFWWTLAHELAHVILHIKSASDSFLDNLSDEAEVKGKEREADAQASKWFRVEKLLKAAVPYAKYMTEVRLREISEAVGLGPELALGILQFNKVVEWRTLPKLKNAILFQIATGKP